MGRRAVSAATALREATQDLDEQVRKMAERTLAAVDEAGFRRALADVEKATDADAKVKLLLDLGRYVETAEAVTVLLKHLEHPDAKVRAQAARTLGACRIKDGRLVGVLGSEADRVLPPLIKATKDADREVRWLACNAIGKLGSKAADAVPRLGHAIADKDDGVAANALMAVAEIGVVINDDATFQLIVDQIKRPSSPFVRQMAATAATIGRGKRQSLPGILIEAFAGEGPFTDPHKTMAAESYLTALGVSGAESPKAIEFLGQILADRSQPWECRVAAAGALARIGKPAAKTIPVLEQVQSNPEEEKIREPVRKSLEMLKAATSPSPAPRQ
jgi:HEAT repeat protein